MRELAMPLFELRDRAAQQCAVCGVMNDDSSTDSRVVLSRSSVPAEQRLLGACSVLAQCHRFPV